MVVPSRRKWENHAYVRHALVITAIRRVCSSIRINHRLPHFPEESETPSNRRGLENTKFGQFSELRFFFLRLPSYTRSS